MTGQKTLPATPGATQPVTRTLANAIALAAGVQAMRITVAGESRAIELDAISISVDGG